MAFRFKQSAKAFIVGIPPPVLIASLFFATLGVIARSTLLHATSTPDAAPPTTNSIDHARTTSLLADAYGIVDSDKDGLSGPLENFVYGTDPNASSTAGSRIPDGWLVEFGLDP